MKKAGLQEPGFHSVGGVWLQASPFTFKRHACSSGSV